MRRVAALLAAMLLTVVAPPPAMADDAPGPPLSTPRAQLDAALTCTDDLRDATRDPVLLTPAFSTDRESYGWNYLRALPAAGVPTCSLSLPDHGYGDLQAGAEYVVNAVRRMQEESGRQIALVGHQHGSLLEHWALLHWPDLPAKVSDLVSLATPWQGTASARFACDLTRRCPPAAWQISTGSQFLEVVEDRGLPEGVAYTSIATVFDPLITPQPKASRLDGASNVVLQKLCPLRPVEHFTILGDNVAYRLVRDALDHPGPADPRRIPKRTCLTGTMPGVTPTALIAAVGALTGALRFVPATAAPDEPRLAAYARSL